MLKVLGILFSLYFAIILVKHSHAGVKAADALAVEEKLLKLENYSASVHYTSLNYSEPKIGWLHKLSFWLLIK